MLECSAESSVLSADYLTHLKKDSADISTLEFPPNGCTSMFLSSSCGGQVTQEHS